MRFVFGLILILAVVVGGYLLLGKQPSAELAEIEPAPIQPEPPKIENDLNQALIARLISEDTDIKKALEEETETVELSQDDPMAELYGPKSNDEILFDMMANWFYMGYRNVINNESQGQFKNTNTMRKSGWLTVGGTLEGAEIVHLDAVKAVVQFADATHEFLYIPEFPEKLDPTVPRTPEQIRAAQLRYSQQFLPKFIKGGREYERLRGRKTVEIPSREEQLESGKEYLEYAREFAANRAPSPPAEALIDASELTEDQREAHKRYTEMFKRSSDDVLETIETQRQAIENELVNGPAADQGNGGTE